MFWGAFYRGWYVVVHLCSNFALRRQMAPVQSIKFQTANYPIFCTRIIAIFWTTCIARGVFSLVIMGDMTHILPVLHWLEVVIAFVSIVTIHLCRGRLVSLCIQQLDGRQTGNNFVADTRNIIIDGNKWIQVQDTTCTRQHVSLIVALNAALRNRHKLLLTIRLQQLTVAVAQVHRWLWQSQRRSFLTIIIELTSAIFLNKYGALKALKLLLSIY